MRRWGVFTPPISTRTLFCDILCHSFSVKLSFMMINLWSCSIFIESFLGVHNFAHIVFSVIVNCIQTVLYFKGKSGVELSKRTHLEVPMWLLGCDCQQLKSQLCPVSTLSYLTLSIPYFLSWHFCHHSPPTPSVQGGCDATPVDRVLIVTRSLIEKRSLTPWNDSHLFLFF